MATTSDSRHKKRKMSSLLLAIGATFLTLIPAQAAEKIFVTYDPLNVSNSDALCVF
jgi:hypothetical protein